MSLEMDCLRVLIVLVTAWFVCPGCTRQAPAPVINGRNLPNAKISQGPALASSSEVLSSAEIVFEQPSPPYNLGALVTKLQKRLKYKCTLAESAGTSAVVRQIRVDAPTPMFLKFDEDSDDLSNELAQFADAATKTFGPRIAAKISQCRARLQLMGDGINRQNTIRGKSIATIASPQIDPNADPVRKVLKAIANIVHGYLFDYINGKWMYAAK